MFNTQKQKLMNLLTSSEIYGFYKPFIKNASKTIAESKDVAEARAKTESIPSDL